MSKVLKCQAVTELSPGSSLCPSHYKVLRSPFLTLCKEYTQFPDCHDGLKFMTICKGLHLREARGQHLPGSVVLAPVSLLHSPCPLGGTPHPALPSAQFQSPPLYPPPVLEGRLGSMAPSLRTCGHSLVLRGGSTSTCSKVKRESFPAGPGRWVSREEIK